MSASFLHHARLALLLSLFFVGLVIDLPDLLTAASADAIRANIVNTLVALGIPANKWRTSGSLSSIITAVANSIAAFSQLLVNAISGFFLPFATGGWLTLLAHYVYGVDRINATFASGQYTLTNNAGGVYNFAPGGLTLSDPTTGVTFTNTDPVSLGVTGSATAVATFGIQATIAGAAGSANAGDISVIVTPMPGVTGTNALPVVGLDQQSDADLRAVCLQRQAANSVRGPSGAFSFYARFNTDGTPLLNSSGAPVNINRVAVTSSSHTGQVTVTVASPQGVPTAQDLAAATANILANARASATNVTVQAATPINYSAALIVWAKAVQGVSQATLQTAAEAQIAEFLANYDLGGLTLSQPATSGVLQGLFGTGIDGQISQAIQAAGSFVVDVDGSTDLAMVAGQVAINNTTMVVRLIASSS